MYQVIFVIIVLVTLCVAYANGANDNFKGVATLFGSGTTDYRQALYWATITTLLGSVAAMVLAGSLIKSFGGKGLIDDAVATQPAFASAVALGAGLTVLMATRIGMPISTTHSLIGALIGAGWIAGSSLNMGNLGSKFLLPLLTSPVIAIVATGVIYPLLRFARTRMGVSSEFCICVGQETVEVISVDSLRCQAIALEKTEAFSISSGELATCESRYQGRFMGVDAGNLLNRLHFLSAGIVSFARGLNDTPKIAALLLLAPFFNAMTSIPVVGIVIALGGVMSARRVAETMSTRITTMNHGQGFTANIIAGVIVIGASRLGLPVSTTHVSCGALFGIGAVTGGGRMKMIAKIMLAWAVTLPAAASLSAASYCVLRSV